MINSRQWKKLAHAARKLGIAITKPKKIESQSHTANTRPVKPLENSPPTKKVYFAISSKVWRWLVAILTVLGGLSAINSLRYDVSIDPYVSLNPKEPLETRFVLANQGPYSIQTVQYTCEFPGIRLPGVNPDINVVGTDLVAFEEKEIDARGKISLRCESPMEMTFGSTMQISVSYRPSFWPWRKTGGAAFAFKRDDSGNAVWLPIGRAKTLEELKK
jgi:hypothetical protein